MLADVICVQEFDAIRRRSVKRRVAGFQFFRVWLGTGSRAMAVLVRRQMVKWIQYRQWRGRAGPLYCVIRKAALYCKPLSMAHMVCRCCKRV